MMKSKKSQNAWFLQKENKETTFSNKETLETVSSSFIPDKLMFKSMV